MEDSLRRLRRLVSGLPRLRRWLIVLGLSGAAVAVIIIATVDPHGPIAAGLVAAAAVAAIAPIVGPPVARLMRKGPALEVPDTPISSLAAYDLGVHPAVLSEGHDADRLGLTPYLRRSHDTELDSGIMQAAAGGRSIFTVLVGQSATGKTRALFEALNRESAVRDWPLFRPADAGELAALLTQQRIGPRTALWLNETQRYLFGESGPEAARLLARLLTSTTGIIVVGAMWPVYWNDLTQKGAAGDPNAAARELLEGSAHRIDVADHLEEAEVQELAASGKSDPRLAAAVAAAGTGGQVIQNLTGGPELLARYLDGSLFSPIEHALITAALDARRLGHESPLPVDLLTAAADGYVTDSQRPDPTAWVAALTAITRGKRADNTPTGVRTLTALTTHRVRGQTDPDYQPSDFLDQNTRRLRQACLGPDRPLGRPHRPRRQRQRPDPPRTGRRRPWPVPPRRSLVDNSGNSGGRVCRRSAHHLPAPGQPRRHHPRRPLGRRVRQPGQPGGRRPAAAGAARGRGPRAVSALLARDPARYASLDNPRDIAGLMQELAAAAGRDAVSALLARGPAEYGQDDPAGTRALVQALVAAADPDEVGALLARYPAGYPRLDNPQAIASLLKGLAAAADFDTVSALLVRDPAWLASPDEPAAIAAELAAAGDLQRGPALLARDPAGHARLDNPGGVARLLDALREAGDRDAARTLAVRAANAGMFDLFLKVYPDEASRYRFGREPDGAPSQPWKWQEPTS